ncbi:MULTISPECIES: AAA family ATPase [Ruegeria]|uniref:AAA family ATPase n=1 Tax=Ruegeria atlantica TaxID=81569 RepID=A0ABX1WBF1_9RHOB|nr:MULTISPECIES: ATP-binding protein [Ruegeria]NOC85178.1 AAA family ATPase [Ruegeria sp. HKCCD6428]NOD30630.1 AAA family ATPase [Ruegeria atlantica]
MLQAIPTLHLLCGKIASGKSTLAARLAKSDGAVLISEDEWLSALFGDQMKSLQDYVDCALKLRLVMGPHVAALLKAGVSAVLDFPANTIENRAWMRDLLEDTAAKHHLHFLDVSDEVCLHRLHKRNREGAHAFAATEDQYRRIARHFVPPSPEEGFSIITHRQ